MIHAIRPPRGRRRAAILLSLGLLVAVTGCGRAGSEAVGTPVVLASPSALLNPPREAPLDVQPQPVEIADGRFNSARYDVQAGVVRLKVTTRGGPYTLTIPPLLTARQLPADATTEIGLTAPNPGEYTMTIAGQSPATAILNVRQLGGQ